MTMFRNPRFNALGTIDGEIEHPQLGWVPFTASPDDPEPLGQALYAAAMAGEFGPVAEYVPPPPTPPPVPAVISRRQARLALLNAGLLDAVEAAIANAPPAVRITYEDATEWWRDDPLIAELARALGLSESQVDELFVKASRL
jgi:hypothetical protein